MEHETLNKEKQD